MGLFTAIFCPSSSVKERFAKLPDRIGPFLRFENLDLWCAEDHIGVWKGSILFISRRTASDSAADGPVALCQVSRVDSPDGDDGGTCRAFKSECLDNFHDYTIWRIHIDFLQDLEADLFVRYCVHFPASHSEPGTLSREEIRKLICTTESFKFYIPQFGGSSQWYTINGSGCGVDSSSKIESAWWDLFQATKGSAKDRNTRYHYGICSGSQIDASSVIDLPRINRFIDSLARRNQRSQAVDSYTIAEIEMYFFTLYVSNFSQDVRRYLMASIPHVMIWDDNEILEGYGAYPDQVRTKPIIQAIYGCAKRLYLLFQQHSTMLRLFKRGGESELFGSTSHNLVRVLDSFTALVALDCRSDRNLHQCISRETYSRLEFILETSIPSSVQHLCLVLPAPLIWPSIFVAEMGLRTAGFLKDRTYIHSFSRNSRIWKRFLCNYGNAMDLVDEMVDQWRCRYHSAERKVLLQILQTYSRRRSARVTIVSGAMGTSGVGHTFSGSVPEELAGDLDLLPLFDFRRVTNITCGPLVGSTADHSYIQLIELAAELIGYKTPDKKNTTEPMDLDDKLYSTCLEEAKIGKYDTCCRAFKSHSSSPYIKKFLIPTLTSYLEAGGGMTEEYSPLFAGNSSFLPANAWCDVRTRVFTDSRIEPVSTTDKALEFTINVVDRKAQYKGFHEAFEKHEPAERHSVVVPPLLSSTRASSIAPRLSYLDTDEMSSDVMTVSTMEMPARCLPVGVSSWWLFGRRNRG